MALTQLVFFILQRRSAIPDKARLLCEHVVLSAAHGRSCAPTPKLVVRLSFSSFEHFSDVVWAYMSTIRDTLQDHTEHVLGASIHSSRRAVAVEVVRAVLASKASREMRLYQPLKS